MEYERDDKEELPCGAFAKKAWEAGWDCVAEVEAADCCSPNRARIFVSIDEGVAACATADWETILPLVPPGKRTESDCELEAKAEAEDEDVGRIEEDVYAEDEIVDLIAAISDDIAIIYYKGNRVKKKRV